MDGEEQQLWERYRSNDPSNAHQELFFRFSPWARGIARQIYRRVRVPQAEWGDYAHNASIGLLEALSRFDATRGVDFMGFASRRVRGAVFNGLRPFLLEPKSSDRIARSEDRLSSLGVNQFDPLGSVIDTVVGLGIGFLLDGAAQDEELAEEGPVHAAERHQMDRLLNRALASLPHRNRLVIAMHYQEHVPFVEIARLLGVTKGRVSQIHRAAIEQMRSFVAQTSKPGVDR